jgi:hypothetical protein
VTLRKLAVVAAVAFTAFVLVTTVAVSLLWSLGEEPPNPNEPVTTLRQ